MNRVGYAWKVELKDGISGYGLITQIIFFDQVSKAHYRQGLFYRNT